MIGDEIKKKKVDFLMTTTASSTSNEMRMMSNLSCPLDSRVDSSVLPPPTCSSLPQSKKNLPTDFLDDKNDITFSCKKQMRGRDANDKEERINKFPMKKTKKLLIKRKKSQEKSVLLVSPDNKSDKNKNQSPPSLEPLIPSLHLNPSASSTLFPETNSVECKVLNSVRFVSLPDDNQHLPRNDYYDNTCNQHHYQRLRYKHQSLPEPSSSRVTFLETNYNNKVKNNNIDNDKKKKMPAAARFPSGSSPTLSPADYCFYLKYHTLPLRDSSSSGSSSDSDCDNKKKQLGPRGGNRKQNNFPGSLSAAAANMDVPSVSELLPNLIQDMKETPASG